MGDLLKAVALVEAMGGAEFLGRSKVNFVYPARAGPVEQGLEQARRNAVGGPAIASVDEHLAQGALVVAEVEQRHGADDLALRDRHPEIARPALIEIGNILEIGLIR